MRTLLIAFAILLTPAPAHAGTLSQRSDDAPLIYSAAPGEVNDVTFTRGLTGFTLHDAGAEVRVSRPCTAIDAHTGTCPAAAVQIVLGDGDDRAAPGGPVAVAASIDGGPGSDTLTGAEGEDILTGGPGRDVLDGGARGDIASFQDEPAVVVDLADPGPDGPPSAPDTLTGIEGVRGSAHDDVLRGDGNANALDGGAGEDVLDGRDGNDQLLGGAGADRLSGGAGDDELAADTYVADADRSTGETLDCGAGNDFVSEQDRDVLLGCEQLELPLGISAPAFDPRPVIGERAATLRLRCSIRLRYRGRAGCRIRVTVTANGRRLGRRVVRVTGAHAPVRVPLRPHGQLGTVTIALRYLRTSDDRNALIYLTR